MTREEARTIVEALHRAVVVEDPYPSREVVVSCDGWIAGHVVARWYSLRGEGETEEEALRELVACARREAESVARGLERRVQDARETAKRAVTWEAKAATIRALLAPPPRQLSLLDDAGGAR